MSGLALEYLEDVKTDKSRVSKQELRFRESYRQQLSELKTSTYNEAEA